MLERALTPGVSRYTRVKSTSERQPDGRVTPWSSMEERGRMRAAAGCRLLNRKDAEGCARERHTDTSDEYASARRRPEPTKCKFISRSGAAC